MIGLEPNFAGADVKEVRHVSTEIPSGRKAMEKEPEGIDHLIVDDGNAVVPKRLSQKPSCSSYC